MRFKQLLTKTLLIAAGLLVGANSAWADATFWKVTSSTPVTASQTYVSAGYLTVASTSAGTLANYNYTYSDIGSSVDKSIHIRSNAAPSAENPSGTNESGATRLVLTVTNNVNIAFYYRRQADNSSSAGAYTYTENDGKDLLIVNQNAPTTKLTGTMTPESDCTINNTYGHVKKAYTLAAGTYTVYATSTTIQLNAISYEAGQNSIYSKSLSNWSSDDVSTTEGTVDKWYNAQGIVTGSETGMQINAESGLQICASRTTATGVLTLDHINNSIVTIDAEWNIGHASNDSNTPYSTFTYGDLTIKAVADTRDTKRKTTYTINGSTTDLGNVFPDANTIMTIHLKVNSYNGNILEFYIKNGESTKAQFSDLTSTTNHFASATDYRFVTILANAPAGSGSQQTYNYLKSITVSEQEQAIYSYSANAVAGSTVLETLKTGTVLSGESVVYYFKQRINYNGTLYQASAMSSGTYKDNFKNSFTPNSVDYTHEHTYSQPSTPITNVVFLAEGEDIFTKGTGSSADIRCSMGAGGYASSKTAFVTLPAGSYHLSLYNRCSGDKKGAAVHKFYKGDAEEPFFYASGHGYNEGWDTDFTLDATTALYMQGGDNNNIVDWVCIYGNPTNNVVGTVNFSTAYLADMTDKVTLKPGESYHYQFVNYNNGGGNWLNWVLPVYNSSDTRVITVRSDNYEDLHYPNAENGWGSNAGCTSSGFDWENYATKMNGATVDMTVSFTTDKVFTMSATITPSDGGDNWTYSYRNDYAESPISLTSSSYIKVALSVSESWLEVRSEGKTSVAATIGDTGWTTFASPYALDLSSMTASTGEVTAYYASAVGGESVTMTSTESSAVVAGEGIMLKGTAGATITIPVVAASGSAISGNKLVGCTTSTELGTNANYYVLVNNGGTAEFQNLSAHGATIPAGKAYLNNAGGSGSGAKSLTIVFDNETLGINDAMLLNGNAEGMGEKAIFNLSGQRIAAPQKGINIIGGRKVVVK